jgi:alpha-tubulin suppressor-like RCC1 family protein
MMQHVVAIKKNGSLWAWGWNTDGEVGQGNFTNSYRTPTRIGTETSWTQICAGMAHNLALKNDGSLWAWGWNSCGQLGDGTTINRSVPIMLGKERDWGAIIAESYSSIALKSNGTIWGWGLLGYGNGSSNILAPKQIDPGTNWLAISAHDYNLVALKADGTLWLNAASVPRLTENFTQIGQDRDWVAVYAGPTSVFARKNDGSWWACGMNDKQQLGLGTNFTSVTSPQRLPFGFEPWAFAPGDGTTLLLTKDGKLWTWGRRLGAGQPSAARQKIQTFVGPVARRFPFLRFLIKSDIDYTPRLLWELPPEVRRSLGTGTSDSTNHLTAGHSANTVHP